MTREVDYGTCMDYVTVYSSKGWDYKVQSVHFDQLTLLYKYTRNNLENVAKTRGNLENISEHLLLMWQ